MNQAMAIIQLDEKTNKDKQRELYISNLKFDEYRPIYQHPINIDNFLKSGQQFLFRQLVNHIRELYPDKNIVQDIRMYEWVNQEIRKTEEFGHDLQKEIEDQIEKNKAQVLLIDQKIKKTTSQTNLLKLQSAKMSQEIQLLQNFLHNALYQHILKKRNKASLQQQLKSIKKNFIDACKSLNLKIKEQILQFATQYNAIRYEDKNLTQLKKKLTELQSQYQGLSIDHSILCKNVHQLQDQIDLIQQEIQKEKNNLNGSAMISAQDRNSESSFSKSYNSDSSQKLRNPLLINRRHTINYKKQDKTKTFFYCLVVATILLIILTTYKKIQC